MDISTGGYGNVRSHIVNFKLIILFVNYVIKLVLDDVTNFMTTYQL
jgi:hypothetical protein